MDSKFNTNPRSIRARKYLQQGLLELLKEKPYSKISISDIVNKAGLARHTFYNHYETKDDLLNHMIDTTLGGLFSFAGEMDFHLTTASDRSHITKQIWVKFFQIWKDNPHLLEIMRSIDNDKVLIQRIRVNLETYNSNISPISKKFAKSAVGQYILCHNAYAMTGVLRQWIRNGMRHTPEQMADLMDEFSSIGKNLIAFEKFGDVIT